MTHHLLSGQGKLLPYGLTCININIARAATVKKNGSGYSDQAVTQQKNVSLKLRRKTLRLTNELVGYSPVGIYLLKVLEQGVKYVQS